MGAWIDFPVPADLPKMPADLANSADFEGKIQLYFAISSSQIQTFCKETISLWSTLKALLL